MLTWIVVLSLAVYRVTRFLIDDSLIDAPRAWGRKKIVGNIVGVAVQNTKPWRAKLLELSECAYCVSVWVALASVMSARLAGASVPQPFWVWLASCGGAMIVWEVVED